MNALEDGLDLELDFLKIDNVARQDGHVVPVALQELSTGEVLFIGYANEDALRASRGEGVAVL